MYIYGADLSASFSPTHEHENLIHLVPRCKIFGLPLWFHDACPDAKDPKHNLQIY